MSQEQNRPVHPWDTEPDDDSEPILKSTAEKPPYLLEGTIASSPPEDGLSPILASTPRAVFSAESNAANGGVTSSVIEELFTGSSQDDREPFDRPDVEKVGIIGGKGVGKSYLFQSMVYRTYAGPQSGSLSSYLEKDAIRLFSALKQADRASTVNLAAFIKNYETWERLPQTNILEQMWYRLRLHFRTGLFGTRRSALDVEYFDGSGEGFFEAVRNSENSQIWRRGYADARVMVFCLPLWAAFPARGLSEDEWGRRDRFIEGFEKVVQNFLEVRERYSQKRRPVATILALTMADDSRGALATLRRRWMDPYLQAPYVYLKQLRTSAGVAHYLANARRISDALHEEFLSSRDPKVVSIPQKLDFGAGTPWLVPLSAMDGSFLDNLDNFEKLNPGKPRPRLPSPVPIHVELPLLLALVERNNALM